VQKTTNPLSRNILALIALICFAGLALFGVIKVHAWLEIRGIERLVLPFTAAAISGALGNFAFCGTLKIRTWLVFFSLLILGALAALSNYPNSSYYPILTSIPFAAVAALTARVIGGYIEKKPPKQTAPNKALQTDAALPPRR
jgi:hypothetical protein